jgi:hypothetical protein
MGILSKLMFWRRRGEDEEDLMESEQEGGLEGERGMRGIDQGGAPQNEVPPWSRQQEDPGIGTERRGFQQPELGQEWNQPQPQPQAQQSQDGNAHEIILARLDVINAKLDSLSQRLANLERYAAEEEKSARW